MHSHSIKHLDFFKMEKIQLTDIRDIQLADMAKGATACGATLPSGLEVPVTPGKVWVIRGHELVFEDVPEHENPESEDENE